MPTHAPLRLLLVSDDPDFFELTGRAFPSPHQCFHLTFGEAAHGTSNGPGQLDAYSDAHAALIEWDPLEAVSIAAMVTQLSDLAGPIVALGDASDASHIAALAFGADRYLPIPVSVPLLRAHILAHGRRGMALADAPDRARRPRWVTNSRVEIGDLIVDWTERRARVHGNALVLKPRAFEVLAYFAMNHEQLISRETLLEELWDIHFDPGTNVIDVYVHLLRRTLKLSGSGIVFETLRGRGYRIVSPTPPRKHPRHFSSTQPSVNAALTRRPGFHRQITFRNRPERR